MGSVRRKPVTAFFRCGLTLLSLTGLLGPANAGRSSCHRSNFPVPGLRLRKRSGTSSFSTRSPPAVRPWDVNRRATPANISCTAQRTRSFGRVGSYNPRRAEFAAPASFSKISHRRTATKSNQAICRVERAMRSLWSPRLASSCWNLVAAAIVARRGFLIAQLATPEGRG